MTTTGRMEEILDLTLEIIYLLTGENYEELRKRAKPGTHPHHLFQPALMMLEEDNWKRIREIIQKMTELLTGEVPIRCQDYVEEHKDVMMEDELDGSRKRNPPQRCPRPREDLPIPCQDQVDDGQSLVGSGHVEEKIKEEDYGVMEDLHEGLLEENMTGSSTDRNPPQRCPRPLEDLPIPCHDQNGNLGDDNIAVKKEIKLEDEKYGVMEERCEEPKSEMEPSSKRNPPERCPRPRDTTQEDLTIPHHDQLNGGSGVVVKEEFIKDDGEYDTKKELNERHEDQYKITLMETPCRRNPPERCPHPRDSTQENLTIAHQNIKLDGSSIDIKEKFMKDNGEYEVRKDLNERNEDQYKIMLMEAQWRRNPPERCPHPWDSTPDNLPIPSNDHSEDPIDMKVRIKEEEYEGRVRGDLQPAEEFRIMVAIKEEEPSLNNPETHPRLAEKSSDPSNTHRSLKCPSHKGVKILGCSKVGDEGEECPDQWSECGKSFKLKEKLYKHQKNYTAERLFSCSECEKSFIRKSHLLRHLRCHTGERPFSCLHCGKGFKHKADLFRHQRLHTGERPFSCSDCEKCFSQKNDLLVHQKTHTGEKSFTCLECGKCFTTKAHLQTHQKIHTGERTYACLECGKCFIQKQHLIRHERTHTGERPFSCSECGKCFTQKRHLLKHQKTHSDL